MADTATPTDLAFDPDALREKYRQERDKRLRADGNAQYLEITGEFAHYLEDPYVAADRPRAGDDEVEVVVIGGGPRGPADRRAPAQGRRARASASIEKGGDFGGTWYWNRYPGAACDTEAYIYMPLLEETGYIPTEKYAKAPEILAHCQRIAEHFDLYRDVLFQTQITELRWDEDGAEAGSSPPTAATASARGSSAWRTARSTARSCPASPASRRSRATPSTPAAGTTTTRAATATANLTGLADKRVAIIGTGATAIQCVPHLGASAKQLFVFQRTPVLGRRPRQPADRPGVGEVARARLAAPAHGELLHRSRRRLRRGRPGQRRLDRDHRASSCVAAFAAAPRMARRRRRRPTPRVGQLMEMADFEKMEQIRARAERSSRTKTRPKRSSRTTGSSASGPASTTSTCRPSTGRTSRWSTPTGKGVERITENGRRRERQ